MCVFQSHNFHITHRDNCKTIDKFDKKLKTMVYYLFLGKKFIAAIWWKIWIMKWNMQMAEWLDWLSLCSTSCEISSLKIAWGTINPPISSFWIQSKIVLYLHFKYLVVNLQNVLNVRIRLYFFQAIVNSSVVQILAKICFNKSHQGFETKILI